jgi:GntR family transcriptional regulator
MQANDLKRREVARVIRTDIQTGVLKLGSRLPGENSLAKRFAVSRGTIRAALEELAREQLISTQGGVGSFVSFDGHNLDSSTGWASALASSGVQTETEVLRLECIVDPELAAQVATESMTFLAVDRVRHVVDGRAVSLERSRIPAIGSIAEAPSTGLIDGSLSATMRHAGLVASRGEQWVAVAPLAVTEANILKRNVGELFLHSTRLSFDSEGRFVEKVVSWLDPERFRLHVKFGA